MTLRRYGDDEVREIFAQATAVGSPERSLPAESGGLTLEQLQQIGREAGIEPARIAQAAASLEARGKPVSVRRTFGLPIAVSRIVDLPRAPTDREWEQLIAEFRSTFSAHGIASASGGLREWSNGNLHISVEPTARGEQLRLSTVKADAQVGNAFALLMAGMATLMGTIAAASGKLEKALVIVGLFGGMSAVSFGRNLLRSPAWARERERQMNEIAEHAVRLLSDR